MGIRRRILLSFLLIFVVVFAATALISPFLIEGAVEDYLESQTRNLAGVFARNPDFENSVHIRDAVRQVWGAETVSIGPEGMHPAGPRIFRAPTTPGRELVLVYSPGYVSRQKSEMVQVFAVVAGAGLLLVVGLGYVTAHAVSRPLERLAGQARSLPAGEVKPVGGGPELDQLVEALNRMLAEVRRAERLAVMGQMAAGVAHEIRNPLSSIKMTVQMLRENASKPEPYDLVLREIERLELTAAELVGVSQPLRKEPVKLDAIVDEVLDLMRRRLEHLAVHVDRHYAATPTVQVDVARFKRCVMNLVLNGAQAMPSGGSLAVDLAPRDGRVRLAFTDGGAGVAAEVRERIFEPFVTTKQDGVGLGLALTKRIVEDHGGEIGYEAAARGTTFWIELPHG